MNNTKLLNEDGSINVEELNKAYAKYYAKYDEEVEMRKLIEKIIRTSS